MLPTYCKQVGPWRVSKEVIGSGTTSTVHVASHTTIPTLRAAVKIVSRTGLLLKADGDPTALHLADAVIHREVLLMKLASHERIIKLYDFVEHGDLVYMILEHAPNKTLFDLFRSHRFFLSTSLVTHLFSQLMHAIEHLHSLHIVHRDIKLENVFLFGPDVKDILQPESTRARSHKYKHLIHNVKHAPVHTHDALPSYTDLVLKLGDFGLSHTHSPTTLSTVFHGSPHYQAPELWGRVPHRAFPTDVWSAGVVLFALIGRRLPFGIKELEEWGSIFKEDHCDESHMEVDHANTQKNAKKRLPDLPIPRAGTPFHMPYNVPDKISSAFDHLLRRLFALDPAKRPTAREVLSDPLFRGSECASSHEGAHVLQGSKNLASRHLAPPQCPHTVTYDAHDLYDLATLCTPPSKHIPREAFCESSFERKVQRRLASKGECIEKVWASRLKGWVAWEGEDGMGVCNKEKSFLGKEKEKGENGNGVHKETKVEGGERKGWGRSLGRIRGTDVRGHLVSLGHLTHFASRGKAERAAAQPENGSDGVMDPPVLKSKISASLSFRSLKIKRSPKRPEAEHSRPAVHTPPPRLTSVIAPHNDGMSSLQNPPSSIQPKVSFCTLHVKTSDPRHTHLAPQSPPSVAQTPTRSILQSPLARTISFQDNSATFRSQTDATSALQSRHDALLRRAYELGFGTQDLRVFADEAGRIVRDVRDENYDDDKGHCSERDMITSTARSSSTTTTLVPENGGGEQKGSVNTDVRAVEVAHAERSLNVNVDVTFDVNFETDLRWM